MVAGGGEAALERDAGGAGGHAQDLGVLEVESAAEGKAHRRQREAGAGAALGGERRGAQSMTGVGREAVGPHQWEAGGAGLPLGQGAGGVEAEPARAAFETNRRCGKPFHFAQYSLDSLSHQV